MSYVRRLLSRLTGSGGIAGDTRPITFAALSETPDPKLLPRLDHRELDEAALSPEQRAWRQDGVVILPRFLPDDVTAAYIARRARLREVPAAGLRRCRIRRCRNSRRCASGRR